jgi:GT2 family glycosyltransferase
MKVAAVILNYNSSQESITCAESLLKQQGVELSIFVVDNCSELSDLNRLNEFCQKHKIPCLLAEKNGGYNAGNNIGLRRAVADGCQYALIVNPDVVLPSEHYVERLAAEMLKRDDTVVTCSDIVYPNGFHQNPMKPEASWSHSLDWVLGLFNKKRVDAYEFIDHYEYSHECRKVSGCCFLIDLSFLAKQSFLDEGVFLYCEEAILSKQVERQGKRMYYIAEIQAVHNHRTKTKSNRSRHFAALRHSRVYYIRHYSGYNCFGKGISILSISLYTGLMQLMSRTK